MATQPTRGINRKLNDVEEKIKVLISAKQQLMWKVSELQRENNELKTANATLTEEIREIRKKHFSLQKDFNKSKNFAKIVTNKLTPTGGLSELKESVERYIEEIDKCIEMLEGTL
jgi:DNA repair exonuclease SbcCD ATPase subunit